MEEKRQIIDPQESTQYHSIRLITDRCIVDITVKERFEEGWSLRAQKGLFE